MPVGPPALSSILDASIILPQPPLLASFITHSLTHLDHLDHLDSGKKDALSNGHEIRYNRLFVQYITVPYLNSNAAITIETSVLYLV
jgi:hypothetical protein